MLRISQRLCNHSYEKLYKNYEMDTLFRGITIKGPPDPSIITARNLGFTAQNVASQAIFVIRMSLIQNSCLMGLQKTCLNLLCRTNCMMVTNLGELICTKQQQFFLDQTTANNQRRVQIGTKPVFANIFNCFTLTENSDALENSGSFQQFRHCR